MCLMLPVVPVASRAINCLGVVFGFANKMERGRERKQNAVVSKVTNTLNQDED